MNTHHRFLYRPPPRNHPALLRCALTRPLLAPPPPAVDLRPFFLPPRDQGQEGCCSGFGVAALRESVLAILNGLANVAYLSPAYLYARTRMIEGSFPQDAGATVADELTTLENYGVCLETDLPYNQDPSEAPAPHDDVHAVPFRVSSFQPVAADPASIESALAGNQAVVFGMPVHSSFERTGADGLVAVPAPGEQCLGGHCMVACGYTHSAALLTVRNSWGPGWAVGGYCFLPFSLISSFFEAYVIPVQ